MVGSISMSMSISEILVIEMQVVCNSQNAPTSNSNWDSTLVGKIIQLQSTKNEHSNSKNNEKISNHYDSC